MRALWIPIAGFLLLAGCGGTERSIEFGISPGQEAEVVVTNVAGHVAIENTGTTALEVSWPEGTSRVLVAPGNTIGRALEGDVRFRVFAPRGLGGRAVVRGHAAGLAVRVVPTTREADR